MGRHNYTLVEKYHKMYNSIISIIDYLLCVIRMAFEREELIYIELCLKQINTLIDKHIHRSIRSILELQISVLTHLVCRSSAQGAISMIVSKPDRRVKLHGKGHNPSKVIHNKRLLHYVEHRHSNTFGLIRYQSAMIKRDEITSRICPWRLLL